MPSYQSCYWAITNAFQNIKMPSAPRSCLCFEKHWWCPTATLILSVIARQHFVSSIWLVISGNQLIQARFSCCVSKSTQLAGPMCLCQCLFFKGEVGCLGVSGVPESSVSSNLRLPRIPHHLLQLPAQVASEEIIVQQSHGRIFRLSLCGVCRVDLRSVTAGQVCCVWLKRISLCDSQSLVKRHRYAEKMEEEVKKLKDKRRGLGIDQDLGVRGQTCSVEDEDLVLEHKTIKKMNVDCEISRIRAHGQ